MSKENLPPEFSLETGGSIKNFSHQQLEFLAGELRRSLIEIVQATGGHLASNLGVVELSIAMHYVFDSPRDAFLWDVGHQAYVHKMLTGRWRDFYSLRQRGGLSGFPRRDESLHDYLNTGHAGTAISAGLGLELGRHLDERRQVQGHRTSWRQGTQNNELAKVFCVVGDASLTSGMAFEAMNHCGHQANRLVVVMNDNKMSIAPNVGAVSRILSRLTAGSSYGRMRVHLHKLICRIPLQGGLLYRFLRHLKIALKKILNRHNLFTELGFKYIGPIDGHDIKTLVATFKYIARLAEPVFLHVYTQKGRGLKEAEESPAEYHGVSRQPAAKFLPTFTESFSASLMELVGAYPELVCISAAMVGSTGLQHFAKCHPERFFDVGIAEQHAVTLACGLALTGKLPLVAIYSTFMQRALDQLIHDISLMNLPAIFICDRAGIVPGDGDTHQGIYDIAHFRSIIGLQLYSPGTQQQLQFCLAAALARGQREIAAWRQRRQAGQHDFRAGPVVIRLPKRSCPDLATDAMPSENSGANREQLQQLQFFSAEARFPQTRGSRALLLCSGSLLPESLETQQKLAMSGQIEPNEMLRPSDNISLDILQLCQLNPFPVEALANYISPVYRAIFCIEDGVVQGGIGQELLRFGQSLAQTIHLRGVEGAVPQLGTYQQLLEDYGLDATSLATWISRIVNL